MAARGTGKRHVTLVDDDDSLRRALTRAIRLAGFEIDAFESAEALLASRVPHEHSCLILDIDLPGIDGIDLKRALARKGCDMPTVFITALGPSRMGEALAALAPVAVLYKPFDKSALLEAIERGYGFHRSI